jgi:hypothetical protein
LLRLFHVTTDIVVKQKMNLEEIHSATLSSRVPFAWSNRAGFYPSQNAIP